MPTYKFFDLKKETRKTTQFEEFRLTIQPSHRVSLSASKENLPHFKAMPMPDFTQHRGKSFLPQKELTMQQPFNFATEVRLNQNSASARKSAIAQEQTVQPFKAREMPNYE